MTAYVVIDLNVADAAGFQEYVDGVGPLIEKTGARNLIIDDKPLVLEGDWSPRTLVIHEFENKEAVEKFWNSPEYQPFKQLRRKYSTVQVVVGEA
ncbi:DUF1330 domain-containing protein [Lentzea flava]|uniref:DUF1330 domain-containing protein n=1 Tax=Lentzea flava TaxID=103732 RepID=A0ABQ2URC4_9PSEU|nr:DUF1330 domain-containing protein [Lentzea flava]MCP2201085.1 Uncharacterized conserved protein, DUF1330 family [Lentzea flava]GGU47970.1 hypothetical protein GCM10010178_45830 [Lentzea flava]